MTNEFIDRQEKPSRWADIAVGIANRLEAGEFSAGDMAELRRMDPDNPNIPAFWRLAALNNFSDKPAIERKWALVIHGISLMTYSARGNSSGRSAHNAGIPVGKALFYGSDFNRDSAFFSVSRLTRLLTARGPMLQRLMGRMFRMMRADGAQFDWSQMAQLILSEGSDKELADSVRMQIARDYFRSENRAVRSQNSQAKSSTNQSIQGILN